MKINKITLNNFGSYEDVNILDFNTNTENNIILIGGKNGAGKTTLFTAIRLCLYGYMSMGHKNINGHYTKAITKLINNSAKLNKPTTAYVSLEIELNNGQGVDVYLLTRIWTLSDTLSEKFQIRKNGIDLTAEEIGDFEKYLLSLIPPELFNLYFFDGEKIADFFLNDGSNERIKDAFLTLCGYDTFDIMRKNFKRISSSNSESSPILSEYIQYRDNYFILKDKWKELNTSIIECKTELDMCNSDIISLDKNYSQNGGITQEEWNNKLNCIKEEERKRENWNSILKKWANDIIPFIMIRPLISELRQQITNESNNTKCKNFCDVLNSKPISVLFLNSEDKQLRYRIEEIAKKEFGDNVNSILDLSLEQSATLISVIDKILQFDDENVLKCKKSIKKSISKSAKIRKELENSSVSSVQEYMSSKAELLETKSNILSKLNSLEIKFSELEEKLKIQGANLSKKQSQLESELKKASINDISAKAIIMLDNLQKKLYTKQIRKVEDFFRKEIHTLMRKTKFIDDIEIDESFNVKIFRIEEFSSSRLFDIFTSNSEEQIVALLGKKAINSFLEDEGLSSLGEFNKHKLTKSKKMYKLPLEIDKTSLSNGEKQIFIMSLYHSLVQLCNHDIPFIIDTPFARIDTEHRNNISKYFFSKLKGQIFILSTNEEINSSHVQILKEKILATYMLENTDNKRTMIMKNKYFEV
ncbi:AAA family ATPase [bacterium]|nr:AAA family ATPase [bacterium]